MPAPQGEEREKRCTHRGGPVGQPGHLQPMLSQRSHRRGRSCKKAVKCPWVWTPTKRILVALAQSVDHFVPLASLPPSYCSLGGVKASRGGTLREGNAPKLQVTEPELGKEGALKYIRN